MKEEHGKHENSTCTSDFIKDSSHPVNITLKKDRVTIEINGQPFTNLYMGVEAHKPFLYPLLTASGKKITRGYPVEPLPTDPTDHPHQKGLWVGSERVSGMDFWENDISYHRPNMGRVVFKDVLNTKMNPHESSFTMLSDWISLGGETVVTETRTMTFYADPPECRMFDVALTLTAKSKIKFEDHQDAVIGMRLGPDFDEKNGGRPINAQGLIGEAQTRGQRSEWVDWRTHLQGEQVGVALMDHPSNFSSPTRWHIRSMGLLVASPFGQRTYDPSAADGGKTLEPSQELHLRYRVLIHPVGVDVAKAYKEFAAQ